MTVTPADQYQLLVASLRLVAAPPEAQVSALPDFVCLTCEISTIFRDACLLVPELERAKLVTADASAALRRLDDFLGEMPAEAEISNVEMLRSHWYWAEARRRAAEALVKLGEDERPPELPYITWVQ
jgi:hypothetical protein